MNMFKKNGGFTLVELLVVIAILAILSGIAIPSYSGYISKAQEAGDTQIISAVNTAIQAATADNNATVSGATYSAGNITVTFANDTDGKAAANYAMFTEGNTFTFKYYTGVTVENGLVKGVKAAD